MEFDEDLAAIHAYLCADGYVIKNPPSQKHKYYHIGLRNTNYVLLEDFQKRFYRYFGITPIIKFGRAKIQNKLIYEKLTERYTYYSDKWNMPKLNKKYLSYWLRAYFDCDGWVYVLKAKNRKISLDSINHTGLLEIQNSLFKTFLIKSIIKKRKNRHIWSLSIFGKDNIERFAKNIGFLHPKKKKKLNEAILSYVDYNWLIPENKPALIKFIKTRGRLSKKRGQVRFNSILKTNLSRFKSILNKFGTKSIISKKFFNGNKNGYYTLSIKLNDIDKWR
ncbi:MAG: LAGLIDADG family homing endonuclease [Candidatus Micrarchaeota archaeon]